MDGYEDMDGGPVTGFVKPRRRHDPDCESCAQRIEYEGLHEEIRILKFNARAASSDLAKSQERVKELERENDKLESVLVAANRSTKRRGADLDSARAEVESLKGEVERQRAQYKLNQERLAQRAIEFAAACDERDEAQADNRRLREGIDALKIWRWHREGMRRGGHDGGMWIDRSSLRALLDDSGKGERVIPQRCHCGPLPVLTTTREYVCGCGTKHEAKLWGTDVTSGEQCGPLAWFATKPDADKGSTKPVCPAPPVYEVCPECSEAAKARIDELETQRDSLGAIVREMEQVMACNPPDGAAGWKSIKIKDWHARLARIMGGE
jgi:hypothetical protein